MEYNNSAEYHIGNTRNAINTEIIGHRLTGQALEARYYM